MKRLKVDKTLECMNCFACVQECAEIYFKSADVTLAALRIEDKGQTPGGSNITEPVACIQCGKCAKECPENAITQNKFGVYMVNKKACVACGKCVEVCPMQVMRCPEETGKAFKCIACGKCAEACPIGMLSIFEK